MGVLGSGGDKRGGGGGKKSLFKNVYLPNQKT